MRGVVFGAIGVNTDVASPDPCGGSVPKAGALVLTFLLNNFRDPEYQQLAEKWEKEVRCRCRCRCRCKCLRVVCLFVLPRRDDETGCEAE